MNKICRICLEEGILSSIFTKTSNMTVCDMIEYCSGAKLTKNEGLPEQICSDCVYKLGIAYHFKQTFETADNRLRLNMGLRVPNKTNDVSVMTDPVAPTYRTIIKKCKCMSSQPKKRSKRKPESEKLKRGPKPKPKKINACYQCNKEFKCPAQLEAHIRTHTGDRPFRCMYCERQFTQKTNLTIHLRLHTGEKPFKCNVCGKKFSAQGNFNAHCKIHTGKKDHVCSICSKSFITSSELNRHMNKHSGERKYKCDLCECKYMQNRDLKIHKMKKHQLTQEPKVQNEAYNKSNYIDIIGVDEGNTAYPVKEVDSSVATVSTFLQNGNEHKSFNFSLYQAKTEKEMFSKSDKSLSETSVYQSKSEKDLIFGKSDKPIISNISEYTKSEKAIFSKSNDASFGAHVCTICGEEFNYLAALAQHCLYQHKTHH